MDPNLESCLKKISYCVDCGSLYALKEEFNDIGLAIAETNSRRVILCRLEDGRPKADKIIDDFIFIGWVDSPDKELAESAKSLVLEFVRDRASGERPVIDASPELDQACFYGRSIAIDNEGASSTMQEMGLVNIDKEGKLLASLKEWLDN